ncbi:Acetate kinase [bioreactor metagenome]|uniref:Acetate kinase n=1 Tax=bioreactor metagenome TaxID=1076179 RepID=A0A645J214_9ZZZZ
MDAIIFTAGIGENQPKLREEVLDSLSYRGVRVDREKNAVRGKEIEITTPDSTSRAFVIPTNEELVIARDTMAIVTEKVEK